MSNFDGRKTQRVPFGALEVPRNLIGASEIILTLMCRGGIKWI